MSKRGRKPKPISRRKQAGNPGKRPLPDGVPQPRVPARLPSPPDALDEDARRIWRVVGRELLRMGVFSTLDTWALAMFCSAASRWMKEERIVAEMGTVIQSENGGLSQNPHLAAANRAWEQMRRMLGELGLSPAERSRLQSMVVGNRSSAGLAERLAQALTEHDEQ